MMFEKLPVPSKGDKLRASWGAGVTNRVNELGAMAPAGMLLRDGPTGTGFAPLPANLRDRRAIVADPLHPWKVFGLKQTGPMGERNLFKIYTPGGPSLRCKVFIGSDLVNVDGLTLRQVQGENNDYCYFEYEDDLEDGEHTLYIVIYLTEASGSASSEEEGVVDFELAAKMVVDPEAFKEEDYVHAVYAIVPVATIRIAHEGEDEETGEPSGNMFCKVESQRLLGDVVYEAEYYL